MDETPVRSIIGSLETPRARWGWSLGSAGTMPGSLKQDGGK